MFQKINTMLALVAGASTLLACSNEQLPETPELREMTFSFTQENDTKATVSGTDILWETGDKITVIPRDDDYEYPSIYPFSLTQGAGTKSASFEGVTQYANRGYYVIYPYLSELLTSDFGHNLYLEGWNGSEQPAHDGGGIDQTKILMGSYVTSNGRDDQTVHFGQLYNLCSYVRFTLVHQCSKVVFKSNKDAEYIASRSARIVDLQNGFGENGIGIHPYDTPTNYVTLVPGEGTVVNPGTYIISVLPTTLKNGFTISEYTIGGGEVYTTMSTNMEVELKRSHILNLGIIDRGIGTGFGLLNDGQLTVEEF